MITIIIMIIVTMITMIIMITMMMIMIQGQSQAPVRKHFLWSLDSDTTPTPRITLLQIDRSPSFS